MRPKVVITLILGAALVVALALLAKLQHAKPVKPAGETVAAANTADSTLPPLAAPVIPNSAPVNSNPHPVAQPSAQDDKDAKAAAEIMRINAVIGQDDSNSVALIFTELTNDDQSVRDQAVAAIKQLGDRSVIPALTNLAAMTEDYEQRHALIDAANFLALPTLTEMDPNGLGNPTLPSKRHVSSRAAGQQGGVPQAAPGGATQ